MSVTRLIIFVTFIFGSLAAHAARYEVAALNYQNNKFKEAYEQFLELAGLGNKDAQYALGLMYLKGNHVEQDDSVGVAWLKLSSSKGDKEYSKLTEQILAESNAAQLSEIDLAYDELSKRFGDDVVASKLMPKLIKSSFGQIKSRRPLVKVPPEYPREALKAGLIGNVMVSYMVADDGRVKYPRVEQATNKTFIEPSIDAVKSYLYRPAIVNNMPSATFDVRNKFTFELTEKTQIREKKLYRSLLELREKADTGTSVDRYTYAKSANTLREYLPSDKRKEFMDSTLYFSKSAVDGLPHAQYELGKSIMYGEQCESDFDTSYFWLERAAQDGLVEAQMMLGLERLNGVRFDASKEEGLRWLTESAKAYDPAKVELAVAYIVHMEDADRNIEGALSLLGSVKEKKFEDKITLLEARALVHLAGNNEANYKKALKALQKEAKKLKLPYNVLVKNIERRIAGEPVLPLKS